MAATSHLRSHMIMFICVTLVGLGVLPGLAGGPCKNTAKTLRVELHITQLMNTPAPCQSSPSNNNGAFDADSESNDHLNKITGTAAGVQQSSLERWCACPGLALFPVASAAHVQSGWLWMLEGRVLWKLEHHLYLHASIAQVSTSPAAPVMDARLSSTVEAQHISAPDEYAACLSVSASSRSGRL